MTVDLLIMSQAADRTMRLRDVFVRAWRIRTGSVVVIFSMVTGDIINSLRIASSMAFSPVPIWRAETMALAAASLAVGGLGEQGEFFRNRI